MNFNLKEIREKLNLRQEELAHILGISQDKLSRIELSQKNNNKDIPEEMDLKTLLKLSEFTGLSPNKILNYKPSFFSKILPKKKDIWSNRKNIKDKLYEYIENIKIENNSLYKKMNNEGLDYLGLNNLRKSYKLIINNNLRKPVLSFVGKVDSGKSTLINSLIGSDKLPVNISSVTAVPIYVKHILDKPDFIKDEVVVFKKSETTEFRDPSFLTNLLFSEEERKEIYENNKIKEGDVSILEEYAVKSGDYKDVSFAVIYVNSDILKDVDFIDYPGYSEDGKQLPHLIGFSDGIVFVSKGKTFLENSDVEFLYKILSFTKKENLFVVLSQAKNIDGSIEDVLQSGLNNYENNTKDKEDRVSSEELKERCFSFAKEDEKLQVSFIEILNSYIEKLYSSNKTTTKKRLLELSEERMEEYKTSLNIFSKAEVISKDKNKIIEKLSQFIDTLPTDIERSKNEITHIISLVMKQSMTLFELQYKNLIDEKNLVSLMKEMNIKKRQADYEVFCKNINKKIEDLLHEVIKDEIKEVDYTVKENTKKIKENYEMLKDEEVLLSSSFASFDENKEYSHFITSIYENPLLFKNVSGNISRNTMGGREFSVIAATAGVASMSLLIPFGLTLTLIAGITGFGMLSGGWQKDLAKKFIKEFEEQDILKKYKKMIEDFWMYLKDMELKGFNILKEMMINTCKYNKLLLEESSMSENIKEMKSVKKKLEDFVKEIESEL